MNKLYGKSFSILFPNYFLSCIDTYNYMTGYKQEDLNGISDIREDPIMQQKDLHINNFDVFHYLQRNENQEQIGI
jgi:hypothetical protein